MKKRGFSLLEVIAIVAIFTLIAQGMLQVFRQGSVTTRQSQQRTAAYSIARATIEEYFNWATLPAVSVTPYNLASVILNGITYSRSLVVSNGPSYPAEIKQYSVTVSWGTESFTLTTLRSAY